MYGIMYNALSEMIVKGFGEQKWKYVLKESDIELGGGSFLIHRHYNDDIMTRLLNSAAKILGLPYDELVERYGEHFFKYCLECGYERLLRVLGRNLYDFLCNLDALHDHLTSIYPGMRAPSFRCYLGDDGSMTLRYYSDRVGLERMVSGIIKAVAREFFDTKVSVTLASRKGKRQDHTVFHVKEDNFTTILVRKRSSSLVSVLHRAKSSTNPKELPLGVMTFCKAFPFHLIFDRHFQIVQAGAALCRVLKNYRKVTKKLMFNKIFQVVRPVLNNLSFETILDHINTVFIVLSRSDVIDHPKSAPSGIAVATKAAAAVVSAAGTSPSSEQNLRLKGQMVFIPESDSILFLCSPRVADVDELGARGLFLSDIPIHDATRDLILITQARRAERELVETLEETSNNLKKLQCKLQEDKHRTDELLNSLLPSAIAERLRLNQSVEAEKYNLVTILFSDIVDFTAMCGNEKVVPMDIVRLLNRLYTHFDVLSNVHDVYKVETIGDAYMVVGGMPEFTEGHADRVTSMAFGMMEVSQTVYSPVQNSPIQIRIGIHSGPCVAGVVGQKMPRYCLFGNTVAIASTMENSSLPGKVNISHISRSYLGNQALYEFEENTTRDDLPVMCSFIRLKHNAPRPRAVDLGIPLPRGMFRTPNPSPTTSRAASPVEGQSSSTSPLKLNSPEGTLPKFKMPAIHICDADEEEDFRSNLQVKMDQVAASLSSVTTTAESTDAPTDCLDGHHCSDLTAQASTAMSYREYLFSDSFDRKAGSGAAGATNCGLLFEDLPIDTDMALRRHSHQPSTGCSPVPLERMGEHLLNKSVTLSDMTDPNHTQVVVVSLESPSSISSVSEASDYHTTSGRASETGSPPDSARRTDDRGETTWPLQQRHLDSPHQSSGLKASPFVNAAHQKMSPSAAQASNSADSPMRSLDINHGQVKCIVRRRSEPMKHLDLSNLVGSDLAPSELHRQETARDPSGIVAHHPSAHSGINVGDDLVGQSAAKDRDCLMRERHTPVGKTAPGAGRADSGAKVTCSDGSPTSRSLETKPASAGFWQTARSDRHRRTGRLQTERLSKADRRRMEENGRLVIYFRGRPRSMSPSLRLHPLTVPEGSRSLHDSPFSSPQLTQKLSSLQGELSSQRGQEAFFRHVRLKRRDLNL